MSDLDWSYTETGKDGLRWVEIQDYSTGTVVTSWPCRDSEAAKREAVEFFNWLDDGGLPR